MKALSVQQPWASLIASGAKTLEVRSKRFKYRGPIAIVSAARPSKHAAADAHAELRDRAPRGTVLCVVDIVDAIEGKSEHATQTGGIDPTGQFCLVLRNPRVTVQRSAKGALGFWHLPDHLIEFA